MFLKRDKYVSKKDKYILQSIRSLPFVIERRASREIKELKSKDHCRCEPHQIGHLQKKNKAREKFKKKIKRKKKYGILRIGLS